MASISCEPLESRNLLSVELSLDVNRVSDGGVESTDFGLLGNDAIFTADDGVSGIDLWRTDGTSTGTTKIADLPSGDSARDINSFTTAGTNVFFIGGLSKTALWASDGSSGGTTMLRQFPTGIEELCAVGSSLYISVNGDALTPASVWKSDGTQAGTVKVIDAHAEQLTSFNGELFFVGVNAELWRCDGTTAGTNQITNIGSPFGSGVNHPTVAGSFLFFEAAPPGQFNSLWKTDGSAAGTQLVRTQIGSIADGRRGTRTTAALGDLFMWSASGQVWRSDGTTAGTYQLSWGFTNFFGDMQIVGNKLFYSLERTLGQGELWQSDGTVSGTFLITGLSPNFTEQIRAVGGRCYFTLTGSGSRSGELWTSDGSAAGTLPVTPTGVDTIAPPIGLMSGATVFAAAQTDIGSELWTSDGTPAGTILFREINPNTADSLPTALTAVGNKLFFRAIERVDPNTSARRWKVFATDQSSGVTTALRDSYFNTQDVPAIAAYKGKAVFAGRTTELGTSDLWISDGTVAGTIKLITFGSVDTADLPVRFVEANGVLFFPVRTNAAGWEFWRTDGTTAGTFALKDIWPGTGSGIDRLVALVPHHSAIYFVAQDPTNGRELWRSDGTTAGTFRVTQIDPGTQAGVFSVNSFGDKLWLTADDGTTGRELWTSDGTAEGTHLVRDINPGEYGSFPNDAIWFRGQLLFSADASRFGNFERDRELWISDGTTAGTQLVKDIAPGLFASSAPRNLIALEDCVLFSAENSLGREFWRTDGTPAGTTMVIDLSPGSGSGVTLSSPKRAGRGALFNGPGALNPSVYHTDGTAAGTTVLTSDGAYLSNGTRFDGAWYWSTPRSTTGAPAFNRALHLYRSDGTAAGSLVVDTLIGTIASFEPTALIECAGKLFFAAHRLGTGWEIYLLRDTTAPALSDGMLNPDGATGPKLALFFTDDVGSSLTADDLQIVDAATGQVISAPGSVTFDSTSDIAQFHFAATLADGNYRANLPAGAVTDPAGNISVTGMSVDFFVFAGDANRDRTVNINDFAILASRFNLPSVFSQGDFNYDGVTSVSDFAILAANFNTSLPAEPAHSTASSKLGASLTPVRFNKPDREAIASIFEGESGLIE